MIFGVDLIEVEAGFSGDFVLGSALSFFFERGLGIYFGFTGSSALTFGSSTFFDFLVGLMLGFFLGMEIKNSVDSRWLKI